MSPQAVAGILVTHGATPDPAPCLTALAAQVTELVVVQNTAAPLPALPTHTRVLANERPAGVAANINRGIAETSAPFIVVANPDAIPERGAVAALVDFALTRERCGVAGPELRYPDGSWQPSRRRFPTVTGTLVRRTPLRAVLRPHSRQRAHYLLDERACDPVSADWMLGAFLLLRRTMLDELDGFDAGYRLYGEDIDLCYRAMRAGWERWQVPQAVVVHAHAVLTDRRFLTRRTLWHWRGIARFVRKHPERLRAL